jgi:hypothetical protein
MCNAASTYTLHRSIHVGGFGQIHEGALRKYQELLTYTVGHVQAKQNTHRNV